MIWRVTDFIRTSCRNSMSIQLRWHHHTRHGWDEKARECKHWSESYEECCAESHRNAATKSSYCTTTVLQGKPLQGKRYQTIPQDSPLPFKVPGHPVRLEPHQTERWLGCEIPYHYQLCGPAWRLRIQHSLSAAITANRSDLDKTKHYNENRIRIRNQCSFLVYLHDFKMILFGHIRVLWKQF